MKRCVARCLSGILLVLAVHLAASDVSCAQQPKKGGTLVYASVSGPGTLDPYVASSSVELEVINNVFEGLVTLDANNATRTMLASKATVSADFKTYSFELRKGVRFHNGREMTSADVKASFERYQRVSPNAKNLEAVDHYDTPDPYSFVIVLKQPNVVLLDVLKSPIYPLMILPESQKDKPARGIDLIGTGPYMMGEWVKDSHLVIKRFDDYVADTSAPGRDGYGGRKTVYLDAVRYRFMPEATTRIAALQNGEAQLISTISSRARAASTSAIRGCRFPTRRIIWVRPRRPLGMISRTLRNPGNFSSRPDTTTRRSLSRPTAITSGCDPPCWLSPSSSRLPESTSTFRSPIGPPTPRICSKAPVTGTCRPRPLGQIIFWVPSNGGRCSTHFLTSPETTRSIRPTASFLQPPRWTSGVRHG